MTVGNIYQLMFFLAIALLAVTITVFVLAVSLLGRAVRLSTQEQMNAEQKRKEDTENEIKKIQDMLEQAKSAEKVEVEGLVRKLRDLQERDKKHRNRLRWIKIKPKLLTANWGALVPGALFITSALLSTYAIYYKDNASVADSCAFFSFIALLLGIVIVALTLKVVEGVAITSEETAFVKEKTVFKTALREHEEEKKPELELIFFEERPPFHTKADSTKTIRFAVRLVKGEEATNTFVQFMAPVGFDFPGHETFKQSSESSLPNYISTQVEVEDIHRGLRSPGHVTFRAPKVSDSYIIIYRIFGGGLGSKRFELQVIVE